MSTSKHHPVFNATSIHGHLLKNRLVVAPMSRVSATAEGMPTPIMLDYYEAFAKGGFGLIITEGTYTTHVASPGYPCQPGIVTPQQTDRWADIVKRVQAHGALIICQLMHAGALSQHLRNTVAPSAIKPLGKKMPEYGGGAGDFPVPAAMTKRDLENVKQSFIQSAALAHQAGFNGIEIHAANGYLLDQFLTPYTNLRTDEYGGSVENRFRLIAEIYEGVKQVVPSTFIVGIRLSEGKVNDLTYRWPEGSVMARQVLTEAGKLTPSYFHIAAERGNWRKDCVYSDGTSFTGLAREITKVPVIANGGLHDVSLSEHVLREGHADLIALGKAALADPAWPNHMLRGERITPFSYDMIKPDVRIKVTQSIAEKVTFMDA